LHPVYHVGDTIIFKYEGNLRAKVEGYEIIDGKPWLVARAFLGFKVPFSLVVGVEREETFMLTRRSYLSRSGFYKKPLEVGSRKWLIAELDKYTSIIVRRRDRRCVTCGSVRNFQCSHFYSRRYLVIRFNLINCNAMCRFCNKRHNSNPFAYMRYMQKTYDSEALAELHDLRMSLRKVSDEELTKLLALYKAMV
jgi:hypothetical protein